MFNELLHNMLQSTAHGFVSVPMIFVFMGVLVVAALWRIKRREHVDH